MHTIPFKLITERIMADYLSNKCLKTLKSNIYPLTVTRNSAVADKSARHVYRSVNCHQTFHMLHIFSYCAIVTLSLIHAVFKIFDFKNVATLKNGLVVVVGVVVVVVVVVV